MRFADRFEGGGLGRLDPAKNCLKSRLVHERKNIGATRDIESRLTSKAQRVSISFLPSNKVRKKLAQRAAVGSKIVVDEIDRPIHSEGQELIELGKDLARRFQEIGRASCRERV